MKRNTGYIFLLLSSFLISTCCFSQVSNSGVIKYKATFISKDPAATCSLEKANNRTTIIFKEGRFREDDFDIDMKQTTIYDGSTPFALLEGGGKKVKVTYTNSHNGVYTGALKEDSTYTVTYTNEMMVIAGLPCKKIIIKEEGGAVFIAYITDAIEINNNYFDEFPYKKVRGVPLQFETNMIGNKMLYKVVSVDLKSPVMDTDFMVDDRGYEDWVPPKK